MERSRTKKATLHTFLQDRKAEKGSAFTHTSIYHPIGSFYIAPEDTDAFFELYKESVLAGEDIYLTEKHREVGPVVIDLDFRFDEAAGELRRRYKDEDIDNVVRIYAAALSEITVEPSFHAYVLEKPEPKLDKGVVKDGVHLIFPTIVTTPSAQSWLRTKVMPSIHDALAGLGLKNSISDVVDEAVIERNNWQMLGSKKPHCDMYRVSRIMDYNATDATLSLVASVASDARHQAEYVTTLSIRNKYIESVLKTEAAAELEAFETKMQETKMKKHFKSTILTKTKNCKTNANDDDYKQAGLLVDFLSAERAESYYDWIRVGWCLRNIDHRLLDKWNDFSKKSPKFKNGECDRMWNYMRQDGACLGMGTLHLWAKTDNPEEYGKYITTELRTLIRESANGTEFDIARVIQRKYDHVFAYDAASKMWYYFANHRWHHTSDGLMLKRKLPTEVAAEYRRASSYYNNLANQIEDAAQKNVLDELTTKLQAIVNKLKRASFQSCVMTECAMLFAIDRFEETLDSNRNLVGFENGVYDLDATEFRDGRPEDYVSLSTSINYVPFERDNACVVDIQRFLSQVLPIERVREYVLRLLASFLHGDIREERFHVWTGSGCFAKDTPVLMYDGVVKPIQDVAVGEQIMGDDNTPRNVQQLFRGFSDMYAIVPAFGDPFVVNGNHDLAMVSSNTIQPYDHDGQFGVSWVTWDGKTASERSSLLTTTDDRAALVSSLKSNPNVLVDGVHLVMNMRKVLALSPNVMRFMHIYRSPGVEYESKEMNDNPYMMGRLIAGASDLMTIERIPSSIMHNSIRVRNTFMAGLMEGGNEVEVEAEAMADDVARLARSVGVTCAKRPTDDGWYRLHMDADARALRSNFTIDRVEDNDFYGFELDGNHLFVMGESYTVQSNSNGKSRLIELYQKAYGDYCCTLPIALLTQKRGSSSSASPELARARSKRFACLQEPGENERLNIGLMKEMTGGDKLYARGLYREGMEFKPQFKMILTCNHLPLVPSDDGGTWRRIRVVRFESKFCEGPDPKKPNEFPIDTTLSQKFNDWSEGFMSLLIEYYKMNITEKIKEPDEVLECTREYQRRNDIIADFLDSAVVQEDSGFLQLGEAFNDFKSWLKDEGCTDRSMRKSDFQSYIEKSYGKATMASKLKGWKGYKLKSSLMEAAGGDDYD